MTSKLRVNNIQSSAGLSTITIGASSVTFSGDIITPRSLSNRNLVTNGAMNVAQRGTSTTGITVLGYYSVDRFAFNVNNLGTWTSERITGAAPKGFATSHKMTCTTANAGPNQGAYAQILQYIEARNLQHLNYGTNDAEPLIVSFWVKSNKSGSASFEITTKSTGSDKLFSTSYTINSANTWEYKTISIPADTSSAIDFDNNTGLTLGWWLNSGSNYFGGSYQTTWASRTDINRNINNLGVGGATSDYFELTGVQLEIGTVATPFENRPIGLEIALCERYYQKGVIYGWGYAGVSGNTRVASHNFQSQMRANPSIQFSNGSGNNVSGQTAEAINLQGFGVFTNVISAGNYFINLDLAADAELT